MDKLKERMNAIKVDAEAAEARELQCKSDTREAQARLDKVQGELDSQQRKITLVTQNLEQVKARLAEASAKLDAVVDSSSQDEHKRKELEANERLGDDTLQTLETKAKEIKVLREEVEIKLRDTSRRAVVLERDLRRALDKADAAEKRVEMLEKMISQTGDNLKALEAREGESNQREVLCEEKISFLENQLKETLVRAEGGERQVGVLERQTVEVQDEIASWSKKISEIDKEMENIADMEVGI